MITDVIEVCETSICRHAPLLLAPDGGSCTWHQWPHPPSTVLKRWAGTRVRLLAD